MTVFIVTLLVLAALAVGLFYVYPAGRQQRPQVSAADREYFATSWKHVQGGFVDDPVSALETAEHLASKVLEVSGFAGGEPDKLRARLGARADGYQEALRVSQRVGKNPASMSTEDMRKALMDFHALSDELLDPARASGSRFGAMLRKASS